jgi:ATP-dependent DNA helicase RecG
MDSVLTRPAQYVKGVGPRRAVLLARLGVETLGDILFFLPRSYEDRSNVLPIAKLRRGATATVAGRIVGSALKGPIYRRYVSVELDDDSGRLVLTFFNRNYLAEKFAAGGTVVATGKVTSFRKRLQMVNPAFEHDMAEESDLVSLSDPIVPIYPLTEGLTQPQVRRIVKSALDAGLGAVPEILPADFRRDRDLVERRRALGDAHFPSEMDDSARAWRRFKYEEFFVLEVALALRKRAVKASGASPVVTSPKVDERIRRLFPFRFTGAQDRVVGVIVADLARREPMNRLLQGDVGSGKTAVAAYAMLAAVASRAQVALMAPTEVLAEQHYRTFASLLKNARVRMRLLAGSRTPADRRADNRALASGAIDIAIGTHALVEGDVAFRDLALVVIDEQHKFGVVQRSTLRQKGLAPHVLVMTATPIPRTLMLTVFGDLDVSIIDEMPPGRGEVVTRWVREKGRDKAFESVRGELAEGRQAYVVYPLVEESAKLDLDSAVQMHRVLSAETFADFEVGLIHGRMSSAEKERVMRGFRRGRTDVLVATTVVEVGVDVPNATVMLIEHADRFGLSQLHQLRGRIGRGAMRSYCLLFGDPATDEARSRLEIMTQTADGFRIAEEDLRLRGPGQFFGTRQHGLPELRYGDIIADYPLLRLARREAFELVDADPHLACADWRALRRAVLDRYAATLDLAEVG